MNLKKYLTRERAQWLLVGEPFWSLWGGLIFSTVIMSAIVAWTLQPLETRINEIVNTNVQNTLLNQLAERSYAHATCDATSASNDLLNCISIVGIEDADFREVFKQTSPLNPAALGRLFDAMLKAPPKVVAIDLDMAPTSNEDWPARERLLKSLQELAKVTLLVMVCPQAYSGPAPGELDRAWVTRFGTEVEFASPNLSENGLYFDGAQPLKTLGMVSAALAKLPNDKPRHAGKVDWHAACLKLVNAEAIEPDWQLIHPAAVDVIGFSGAVRTPEKLAGRIVFVGGKWGVNDQFRLLGQAEPVFGVNLHAWVAATELMPLIVPPHSANLILDLFIGIIFGGIFTFIWGRIVTIDRKTPRTENDHACRTLLYVAFLLIAVGLPICWVIGAAYAAKTGVMLGAAGMILSAAADSFLSAHEIHHGASSQGGGDQSGDKLLCGALLSNLAYNLPRVVLFFFSALLGLVLFYYGQSVAVCGAMGILAGAVFGIADLHSHAPATPPDKESWFDLTVRLIWKMLQLAALVWAVLTQFDMAAIVLLVTFLIFWSATYCAGMFFPVFRELRR
jgi:hypothetical protein